MLHRVLLAFATVLLAAPAAEAHKMLLSVAVHANLIAVEVFYEDDTPARAATVAVGADPEHPLLSGATDEKGAWSCPPPPPGKYQVWATSEGHKAKGTFEIAAPEAIPEPPEATPTREEQTQTHWGRLALGLGAIVGVAFLVWMARRGRWEGG